MSTAARKLRKRTSRANKLAGKATQSDFYVHTTKVGTPVMERAIGPSLGSRGNDLMNTQRSKRQLKKRFARLMITNPPKPVVDRLGDPLDLVKEQARILDEMKPATLELDPKPYRVGRKRYDIVDAIAILNGEDSHIMPSEIVWSPRSKYEQDSSKY